MLASATPVTRLVAPGPSVARAHAGAAGEPAVNVGHESGRLFVPRRDEADGTAQQRVHDVQILFAGDAEDDLDALVLKAADQQFGGFHAIDPGRTKAWRILTPYGL